MTEQEQNRRARGRARRARLKRERTRLMGFAFLAAIVFVVMSSTAFDFVKRERVRYLEPERHTVYELPQIPTVVAQAQTKKKPGLLPRLLRFDELFPRYRNPKPLNPEDENSSGGEDAPKTATEDLVVLDDLTAIPPKEMFLDAIYEDGGLATSTEEIGEVKLSEDYGEDAYIDVIGFDSVIPEPSTGLMLGLGLTGLGLYSRRNRNSGSPRPTERGNSE